MSVKVLIVEDDPPLNEVYELLLSEQGYDVAVAFDGEEALSKTKQFEPDLILLDLLMPNMGGIEFLEKYDLVKLHPNTKVIVFSNLDTRKDIDMVYELGVQKYMLKSWASPKELLNIVEDVLAGE